MPKINRVIIDEKGDIKLDYSGYEGETCRIEEDRFRRLLAELGLQVEVEGIFPKKETSSITDSNKDKKSSKRGITL